jgi:dimeric dUTPase (all-alpha-NTP-PPase superfamily)
MAELQDKLDKHILENHKIEGDITGLLVIAFKVEFGEFLNEHKFFKFWKVNPVPRTKALLIPAMMEEDKVYYNPLLEEFVDGVHFLLSIGLKRGYLKFIHGFDVVERKSDSLEFLSIEIFNNPINSAGKWMEVFSDYIHLGYLMGISASDIEEAYLKKNQVNHERQNSGY